jgi:hypothetical protein
MKNRFSGQLPAHGPTNLPMPGVEGRRSAPLWFERSEGKSRFHVFDWAGGYVHGTFPVRNYNLAVAPH